MVIWKTTTWITAGVVVMLFAVQCYNPSDWSNKRTVKPYPRAGALPDSLSTPAFSNLIRELSETGGSFHSTNFTSNESSYLHPFAVLRERHVSGGVYVGVGPEQNFTYIAETRPHMAFVVDIRRDNMLLHLIYKSLFAQSSDSAEFLSRLLSKPLNRNLSYLAEIFKGGPVRPWSRSESSVATLIAYFDGIDPDVKLYERNLRVIKSHLHSYGIDSMEDMKAVERVYQAFFRRQLDIQYDLGTPGDATFNFPSLRELILAETISGEQANFLADDSAFDVVKKLHGRNLIVPVVGDFAGETALRGISDYVRSHDATISVFYVSNVEYYLTTTTYREVQASSGSDRFDISQYFTNMPSTEAHDSNGSDRSTFTRYFDNVSSMPIDESSLFIRSYANNQSVNMMSHPRRIGDLPFTSFAQSIARFTKDDSWRSLEGYDQYIRLVTDGIIDDYVVPSYEEPLILHLGTATSRAFPLEYGHLDEMEIAVNVLFDSNGIVDSIWTKTPSAHPALDSIALESVGRFRLMPTMGTRLIVPQNTIFKYNFRFTSRVNSPD